MSNRTRDPGYKEALHGAEGSAARPTISPGKHTLAEELPPQSPAAAATVQRKVQATPQSIPAFRFDLFSGPEVVQAKMEHASGSDSWSGATKERQAGETATPVQMKALAEFIPMLDDLEDGEDEGQEGEVGAVQRSSTGAVAAHAHAVHEAADRGIQGSAEPLPHGDAIQRSFGHHDVSHIQAHSGPAAAAAAAEMGALAYARGEHVAFGSSPSLHTAAHEAAHVVQQRSGVQLKGGVGEEGDPYERQADAVADLVVRGESAETAIDQFVGGTGGGTAGRGVQRQVTTTTGDLIAAGTSGRRIGPKRKYRALVEKLQRYQNAPDPVAKRACLTEVGAACTAWLNKNPAGKPAKRAIVLQLQAQVTAEQNTNLLLDAIASGDVNQINAAATTPALRKEAFTLCIAAHRPLMVPLFNHSPAWTQPALEAAFEGNHLDVVGAVATTLAARQAIVVYSTAHARQPDLLTVIGTAGDAAAADWQAAVNSGQYDNIIAAAPNPIAVRVQFEGTWHLFGDGTNRSANAKHVTFNHLFTSRIVAANDPGVVYDAGTTANGGITYEWQYSYHTVAPDDAAMTSLMTSLRHVPQGHINTSGIAFSDQMQTQYRRSAPLLVGVWTDHGAATAVTTSYYLANCNKVVFLATGMGAPIQQAVGQEADGHGAGVGGVPGTPQMTWFRNHARHEIGHSVGNRVFAGMAESGDDWARAYGGWQARNKGDFVAAYWTKAGTTQLDFTPCGAAAVDVDDDAVASWLSDLIETGVEPAGNAVTIQPGTVDQKLAVIRTQHDDQQLTKYFAAVFTKAGSNVAGMKDSGYAFPGFVPAGEVYIWCSRSPAPGFMSYSKAAYDAILGTHGWYALASHKELFAEIYTQKYVGGALPVALNGKDPTAYFNALEISNDSQIVPGGNLPPTPGGGGGGGPQVGGTTQPKETPTPPSSKPPVLGRGK